MRQDVDHGVGQGVDGTHDEVDARWMAEAIELSRRCVPSRTAFSVGAVVVGVDGRELARSYSRELGPLDHAEEGALRKATAAGVDVAGATVYSSLEPCGKRGSRPKPCARLIVDAGIARVVYAWAEPAVFVGGTGDELLKAAGVEVDVLDRLAAEARAVNAHLPGVEAGPAGQAGWAGPAD
jgi:diaminohydroxyphosphoribosylaminopyrimidine deaminase / 5-amino-6-(5-phosphoribosylamino)uracil reductase